MTIIRTENRRANAWRRVAALSAIALLGAGVARAQTIVEWERVDHTIRIDLHDYKVTWLPADFNVTNDAAAKTDRLYMRYITPTPAGTNDWMGSLVAEGNFIDPTNLTLNGYYVGVYAVTEAQYFNVMGANPPNLVSPSGDDCPVSMISYNEIRSGQNSPQSLPDDPVTSGGFLGKLRDNVRANNAGLDVITFDLPTEAQWEVACRAGTIGTFNNTNSALQSYLWGGLFLPLWASTIDEVAWWHNYNGGPPIAGPHPVGLKRANRAGLYDMHGNMGEWCLDFSPYRNGDDYTYTPVAGGNQPVPYPPEYPPEGLPHYDYLDNNRKYRGGNYDVGAVTLRSANRLGGRHPSDNTDPIGFRVIATGATADPPIPIGSWTELAKVGSGPAYPSDGNYLLTRDLTDDLILDPDYDTVPGGFDPTKGWIPLELMMGTFDGGGHSISGLWIDRDISDYQGLFGQLYGETVRNLGVNIAEGKSISGDRCIGGIVGGATSSTFTDCYVTGDVYGGSRHVGGIAGYADTVTLTRCRTEGSARCDASFVGGITGNAVATTITDCHSAAAVSGGASFIGGLAGTAEEGASITRCYATGDINGANVVGGLVGTLDATSCIADCYATGDVFGIDDDIGGLVGCVEGSVTRCYATGDVSGYDDVGGLFGSVTYDSLACDSFALNSSVTSEAAPCGRVSGSSTGTLSNNFALATMEVSANGGAYTPTPGHDLKDGADISAADAAEGRGVYEAAGWDFASTWVDAPYAGFAHGAEANLPILRAFVGTEQNPNIALPPVYDWYYVDDDDTWDYAPYIYYKDLGNWMFLVEKLPDGESLSVTNCVQAPESGPTAPLDFSGSVEHDYKLVNFGDGTWLFGYYPGESGSVESLLLPETATNIAANAFRDCPNLAGSLTIPDAVVAIGDNAFSGCAFNGTLTLETVSGASQLTTIGNYAFYYNAFEGNLAIPDAIVSVGTAAFQDCAFDGTLTLGVTLQTIGHAAFYGNTFDGSPLAIPDSVTFVGNDAFNGCVFEDVSSWGTLTTVSALMFDYTTFTTSLFVIPAQIETIGFGAFGYTAFGGDVIVGEGVTSIANEVFAGSTFNRISLPSTGVSFGTGVFLSFAAPIRKIYYRGNFPADPGSDLYFNSPGVTSYVATAWVDDWNANSLANSVANGVDTTAGIIQTELATWHGRPILCGDWDVSEHLDYVVWLDPVEDVPSGYTEKVIVKKGEPMPPITPPPAVIGAPFEYSAFFLGYTNSAGVMYYYADGSSARDWDQDGGGTLYGRWEAKTITGPGTPWVMFYGNGGTPEFQILRPMIPPFDVCPGWGGPGNTLATLNREGFTFDGWNTKPDGSGDPMVPGVTPISGDRYTVYYAFAQWTEIPSPDETWVHVDAINVSPGGDVMLAWAYAPVTNLLRTASYTYVYFVSTDLVTWDEIPTAPVELRDVGGTQDQATLYDTTLPPSNRRFFKVKAVK